jgi:hypothetical protein
MTRELPFVFSNAIIQATSHTLAPTKSACVLTVPSSGLVRDGKCINQFRKEVSEEGPWHMDCVR